VSNLVTGDATLALALHGIKLDPHEEAALEVVRGVAKRLEETFKSSYPWIWAGESPSAYLKARGIALGCSRITNVRGYQIGLPTAKKLWNQCSEYWANPGKEHQTLVSIRAGGDYKDPVVKPSQLVIGCQTLSRKEVEAIAQHYEWEPCIGE
jgi:hypothetical protein